MSNNVVHGLNGPSSHDDWGIFSNGAKGKITIRGNTVYDIGGFPNGVSGYNGIGIEVDNSPTGTHVITLNLVHDIGGNTNTCGGPSGILVYDSDNVSVSHNEVYNVRPIRFVSGCDWVGIDLDGGVTNSQVYSNYTHNNFGSGLLAYMGKGSRGKWGPSVYKFNISENDGIGGVNPTGNVYSGTSMEFQNRGAPARRVFVFNNTIIQNNPKPDRNHFPKAIGFADGGPTPDSLFANNIIAFGLTNLAFACEGRANADWAGMWSSMRASRTFVNNVYYAITPNPRQIPTGEGSLCVTNGTLDNWVAMTGETNTILTNPGLVGPIPSGTLKWDPATIRTFYLPGPNNYMLAPASGLLGRGIDPTSRGAPATSADYFGFPIKPTVGSTGYNLGAF